MKKLQQVSEFRHSSGIVVPIMFNPNDDSKHRPGLTFSAKIADNEWIFKSADEVVKEVKNYLNASSSLEWHPVIEVTESSPFGSRGDSCFVGFEISRYYLAASRADVPTGKEGRLRKLIWERHTPEEAWKFWWDEKLTDDMNRIKNSEYFNGFGDANWPGKLPCVQDECVVMAWNQDVWDALVLIQENIGKLKIRLRELIGTKDGHAKLVELGKSMPKLLPS